MINPQMMGMGNLPNIPTTKELWKNEKSKYRHWIILFSVAILSLLTLSVVSLFLNGFLFKDSIDFIFQKYSSEENSPSRSEVSSRLFVNILLIIAIQVLAFFIGAIMFFKGIFDSYKSKSFERLSSIPSLFMGVTLFIAFLRVFLVFGDSPFRSFYVSQSQGILYFVLQVCIIVVFFSISIQVNRIRRLFTLSSRIEEFKKSPQYQMMQKQSEYMQSATNNPNNFNQKNSSPYAPPAAAVALSQSENNNQIKDEEKPENKILSKEEQKLNKMKINSLKKVASKLFISGFEEMNKQELIKAILRVTQN